MITKARRCFNWGYIIGLWIGLGNAWIAIMMEVSLNWVALGFGIGTVILALLEIIQWRLSKKEELERVNGRYFV